MYFRFEQDFPFLFIYLYLFIYLLTFLIQYKTRIIDSFSFKYSDFSSIHFFFLLIIMSFITAAARVHHMDISDIDVLSKRSFYQREKINFILFFNANAYAFGLPERKWFRNLQ